MQESLYICIFFVVSITCSESSKISISSSPPLILKIAEHDTEWIDTLPMVFNYVIIIILGMN